MTKPKTTPKPIYVISPQDRGYLVNFMEDSSVKKSAHSARQNAINFVARKIPRKHQILITDMGEIKQWTLNKRT